MGAGGYGARMVNTIMVLAGEYWFDARKSSAKGPETARSHFNASSFRSIPVPFGTTTDWTADDGGPTEAAAADIRDSPLTWLQHFCRRQSRSETATTNQTARAEIFVASVAALPWRPISNVSIFYLYGGDFGDRISGSFVAHRIWLMERARVVQF